MPENSPISQFEPEVRSLLPGTYDLLLSSNLTVHPKVERIILHGSRGLAGGFRPDSDLDLSLLVDPPELESVDRESYFKEIFETTFLQWHSPIELDLAIIFDTRQCGLKCFDLPDWSASFCAIGGVDCFGLYKVQKGFHGLIENAGIQVKRMYPCMRIWQKMAQTNLNSSD